MTPLHSSPHPFNDVNVDWNPSTEEYYMSGNPYPQEGARGNGGYPPGYDADQWGGNDTRGRRGRRERHLDSEPAGWGRDRGSNARETLAGGGGAADNSWGADVANNSWGGGGAANNSWGGDAAADNSWGANATGADNSWGNATAPGWGGAASQTRGGPPQSGWHDQSRPRESRDHHGHRSRRAPSPDNAYGYYNYPPRPHDGGPSGWPAQGYGYGQYNDAYMPPQMPWANEPQFDDDPDEEVEEWERMDRMDHENRYRDGDYGGGGGDGGHRDSPPPPLMHGHDDGHGHRTHSRGHGYGDDHNDMPDEPPPLGGPNGGPPPRRTHSGRVKVRRITSASADHLPRHTHGFHNSSGSSFSSGSFGPAVPLQYGGAYPAGTLRRSGTGLGLKKAMRWFSRPLGSSAAPVTLHPLLRPSSLLKPVPLHWDTIRPPLPVRGGIPIGAGNGFGDPATSPPTTYMRLLIPIPGVPDGHWPVNVYPIELGGTSHQQSSMAPGSPYAYGPPFVGSPFGGGSPFPGSLSGLPFPSMYPQTPIVTTAAVLLALHRALRGRATEQEFLALSEARRKSVSAAFYARCRKGGGEMEGEAEVRYGVRRLDFLGHKTRWAGLTPALEMDEWIVRLSAP